MLSPGDRFENPRTAATLEIVRAPSDDLACWKFDARSSRRVHADRALLRILTSVLWPLLENHNVAIKQAMAGLEPYARA